MGALTSPAGTRVEVGDNDALADVLVSQGWVRDGQVAPLAKKAPAKKAAPVTTEPAVAESAVAPVADNQDTTNPDA